MKPWNEALRRMSQAKEEANGAVVWLAKSIEAFEAMTAVLLSIEWSAIDTVMGTDRYRCPSCWHEKDCGHSPECSLDASLRMARNAQPRDDETP